MTESDKALIEQLRYYDWRYINTAHSDAADRLEELLAEIAALKATEARLRKKMRQVIASFEDHYPDSAPLAVVEQAFDEFELEAPEKEG